MDLIKHSSWLSFNVCLAPLTFPYLNDNYIKENNKTMIWIDTKLGGYAYATQSLNPKLEPAGTSMTAVQQRQRSYGPW
jgi:hypothetical protein